ncbi:hypothetical protein E2C01_080410 [Portunus trituberculatus]|uniref:Uncharacterized protein n=1 Tax=Portunus trituberculatus TaxID=210409 RepID=A0A5B7IYC2_PORTR|nr:hypothetical protein [Portunus trituberculatus]
MARLTQAYPRGHNCAPAVLLPHHAPTPSPRPVPRPLPLNPLPDPLPLHLKHRPAPRSFHLIQRPTTRPLIHTPRPASPSLIPRLPTLNQRPSYFISPSMYPGRRSALHRKDNSLLPRCRRWRRRAITPRTASSPRVECCRHHVTRLFRIVG